LTTILTGACAIDVGVPYPDETHEICMAADAVPFELSDIQNTTMTHRQKLTRARIIANA
jgi:hypothetical protein